MLGNSVLARMRLAVNKMFPDSCQIQQVSRSAGGATGQVQTWTTIATVKCRIDPNGADRDPSRALNALDGAEIVLVPYDVVISPDNRLIINGSTYEIKNLIDGHSQAVWKQIEVVRINASS